MAFALTRSLLKRIRILPSPPLISLSSVSRNLTTSTSTSTRSHNLNRLADELLSLDKLERYDYPILVRLRLGLNNSAPSLTALDPSADQQVGPVADAKAVEKTSFDVKLNKFDVAAKIKVIKEVRGFTELGLKEAKDLMEKTPVVVRKGVHKKKRNPLSRN